MVFTAAVAAYVDGRSSDWALNKAKRLGYNLTVYPFIVRMYEGILDHKTISVHRIGTKTSSTSPSVATPTGVGQQLLTGAAGTARVARCLAAITVCITYFAMPPLL